MSHVEDNRAIRAVELAANGQNQESHATTVPSQHCLSLSQETRTPYSQNPTPTKSVVSSLMAIPSIEAAKADKSGEELTRFALYLIEEVQDVMESSEGVRLVGQSKTDARRVLESAKECVLEMVERKTLSDDKILVDMRAAKRNLQRLIMQADVQDAADAIVPAPTTVRSTSPSQTMIDQARTSSRSALQFTLALKQLDCEITRLNSPRLIDVGPGADVKPDVLRDLLQIDVPEVRKSIDRARDALKTLTLTDGADEAKILGAQDICERAINWISEVEARCKQEQLHLTLKTQTRKVDFLPFCPGNGVSIFEFFQKFESWSRGTMSMDQKANILYFKFLDWSVVDGNKDLEDRKENYHAMKAYLQEKWGIPDLVCEMHLENIKKVALPTDPEDKPGMLLYTKNAYSNLDTLTKLESERGQKVPNLETYYYSNTFLKKLHKVLPEKLGSKFLKTLEKNGESYYLMTGHVFLERMMAALRCEYRSLEICLDEVSRSCAVPEVKPISHVSVNVMTATGQPTNLPSSDGQSLTAVRLQHMRRTEPSGGSAHSFDLTGTAVSSSQVTSVSQSGHHQSEQQTPPQFAPNILPRPMKHSSDLTGTAVASSQVTSESQSGHHQSEQHTALQFAPNILSRPLRYSPNPTAMSSHQMQFQSANTSQLEPKGNDHPKPQFCKGPRWACPVKDHSGHDLSDCQDFWGAQSCAVRKRMLSGSGCLSCLGKDQGCQDGRCDIFYQLPPNVVCEGCVKSCPPGKSPSNKMTCEITWHKKKPLPVDDIINAMEAWVPNLNISTLIPGVITSLNMWVNVPTSSDNYVPTDCKSHKTELDIILQKLEADRNLFNGKFTRLQEQIQNQEDKICQLANSCAALKASCKSVDAACQTDPMNTETIARTCDTSSATIKLEDHDAESFTSEVECIDEKDQSVVSQHMKPKKKRKPRKNRSRGARRRAKAAALALLDVKSASLAHLAHNIVAPTAEEILVSANGVSQVPVTGISPDGGDVENVCSQFHSCRDAQSDYSLMPFPCPDSGAGGNVRSQLHSCRGVQSDHTLVPFHRSLTPSKDRRFLIVPVTDDAELRNCLLNRVATRNLFQGFCPPLVDPHRLSRWFHAKGPDNGMVEHLA